MAVVTLAAGVGSRWTTGAGVVKAVNPFVLIDGRHRSFLEIHFAKTRKTQARSAIKIPHVVTTSYLTHAAIERHLKSTGNYGHDGPVYLSPGRSIGQRLIPMTRDLVFLWEESAHETLQETKQKVREASRRAILEWAKSQGEGIRLHRQRADPALQSAGPFLRGAQLAGERSAAAAPGRISQPGMAAGSQHRHAGGHGRPGRARAGDRVGVMPELRGDLRGGSTTAAAGSPRWPGGCGSWKGWPNPAKKPSSPCGTTTRSQPGFASTAFWTHSESPATTSRTTTAKVGAAVRAMAARLPTYVTIKDVKRRWGHGQEDVYPVAQFEKLWGDMSSLPDLNSSFLAVSRQRGQQLKDVAQLDGWADDGSLAYVRSLCEFAR